MFVATEDGLARAEGVPRNEAESAAVAVTEDETVTVALDDAAAVAVAYGEAVTSALMVKSGEEDADCKTVGEKPMDWVSAATLGVAGMDAEPT